MVAIPLDAERVTGRPPELRECLTRVVPLVTDTMIAQAQRALPLGPPDHGDLLGSVVARGPVYRPTP